MCLQCVFFGEWYNKTTRGTQLIPAAIYTNDTGYFRIAVNGKKISIRGHASGDICWAHFATSRLKYYREASYTNFELSILIVSSYQVTQWKLCG